MESESEGMGRRRGRRRIGGMEEGEGGRNKKKGKMRNGETGRKGKRSRQGKGEEGEEWKKRSRDGGGRRGRIGIEYGRGGMGE